MKGLSLILQEGLRRDSTEILRKMPKQPLVTRYARYKDARQWRQGDCRINHRIALALIDRELINTNDHGLSGEQHFHLTPLGWDIVELIDKYL